MKKTALRCVICLMLLAIVQTGRAQDNLNPNDPKMAWWKDAKFGMFIHWGVYSVPGGIYKGKEVRDIGEWIMNRGKIPVADYKAFAKEFNPVNYNADTWVKIAKDAGVKYIVITSKHHDGFAMFDSKVTDWDIVDATPYHKDVLKQLVAACHRQGIKIGFYYSQSQDWNHPGGAASGGYWDKEHQQGDYDTYIDQIAIPQVKEILNNYGDIDILWWDTPMNMTPERASRLYEVTKKYPKLIMNNRLGGGFKGDTETPEQFVPATGFPGRNWETCMTMNDTWGFKINDHNWKSPEFLIQSLVDVVSKGGNLLLNVGPTPLGEIPAPSVERLGEMGKWLKVNGEAVYGTTSSPFPYLSWGRATRKGQKLYLHIFNYPADGKLHVPMADKITNAYLLADRSKKLGVIAEKGRSVISLPAKAIDPINTVVVVQFAGEPDVLPLPMAGKKVIVSSQSDANSKPENITDQDPRTKWIAAKGETHATIDVDLGEPVSIGSFSIDEPWHPWDNKSQDMQLQYFTAGEWKTSKSFKSNGSAQTIKIEPVTAQRFRLVVDNKVTEPQLLNWQIYREE